MALLVYVIASTIPGHKPAQEHMCSAVLKWVISVPISALGLPFSVLLFIISGHFIILFCPSRLEYNRLLA